MKKIVLLVTVMLASTAMYSQVWDTKANMNQARAQHVVVSHPNGKIYSWSGYTGTFTDSIEVYDPLNDTWTNDAALPKLTRGAQGAVGHDSLIYFFGGTTGNPCYKYDVNTKVWTAIATMPSPSWEAHAVTGYDGRIYILGGEGQDNSLHIYDPVGNTWSTGASIPLAVKQHVAVAGTDSLIYVVGGDDENALQIYDPVADSWSAGANMPQERNQMGAIWSPDDKIYVLGGKTSYGNNQAPFFTDVFIYDPVGDTWSTGTSLPEAVGEMEAAIVGGCMYVIGGVNGTYRDSTYQFCFSLSGAGAFTSTTCNGDCDGDATAIGQGGVPPYTYTWDSNAGSQTTSTATGLCAGNYDVTISDSDTSSVVITVTVTEPTVVNPAGTAIDVLCNGDTAGGVAYSTPFGGTPGYTFLWSDSSTTDSISVGPGTYLVTVTDNNGCTDVDTVVVGEPAAILANLSSNADAGGCTGDATATPSGGTPGYTYQWDANANNQTDSTATGLCGGVYYVTITDSLGCVSVDSVFVPYPVGIAGINSEEGIQVYPNPTSGRVFIVGQGVVSVYNTLGVKVTTESTNRELDLSEQPNGVYFIHVNTENGNVIRKITVEK